MGTHSIRDNLHDGICSVAVYHIPVFGLHTVDPPHLIQLDALIGNMAGKQQVVSGVDGPCKSHEQQAVDTHHCISTNKS